MGQFLEKLCKKGCFHSNLEHTVQGLFVDPLFKHRYPLGAKHSPPRGEFLYSNYRYYTINTVNNKALIRQRGARAHLCLSCYYIA